MLLYFSDESPHFGCYGHQLQENTCKWRAVDGPNSFKYGFIYRLIVKAYNDLGMEQSEERHFVTENIGNVPCSLALVFRFDLVCLFPPSCLFSSNAINIICNGFMLMS